MKMREEDVPALLAHFQKEVLSHLSGGVVGCLAIPFLSPAQLADPARQATRYRIPLLNQVAVLGHPPAAARRRGVEGAMRFLTHSLSNLLSVAQRDLATLL